MSCKSLATRIMMRETRAKNRRKIFNSNKRDFGIPSANQLPINRVYLFCSIYLGDGPKPPIEL